VGGIIAEYVERKIKSKRVLESNNAFHQLNEFICKVARTLEEAKKLIENGFEYVTDKDGCKLFKKRK